MPALTFNKFNCFVQDVGRGVHNLHTDALKAMLTDAAPVATSAIKTDIAEISAGNGYTAGGTALTGQSFTQTAGRGILKASDVVFVAVGGGIGPFRYAVLYNDTAGGKPLIGWWDYGSEISLAPGTSAARATVHIDAANGILTLS